MNTVSIAVLTRNAQPLIARLAQAVAGQDTDREVDCLALDSGSTDGTCDLLAEAGWRVESRARRSGAM